MTEHDRANGYELMARTFMLRRSDIGQDVVRTWARTMPPGAIVLDLGCGHGVPISQALVEEELVVYGIDASPAMIAGFRHRFPNAATECAGVEASCFFDRAFDGVVAWGLMFLLAPEIQGMVVRKVSQALVPGGKFLFTSPEQACAWPDALTGLKSVSLGAEEYCRILAAEGLTVIAQERDAGDNHYYLAAKKA